MRKYLLFFAFLSLTFTATAQKFTIRGIVGDTATSPLPSATVMILNPKDSSLVNFGVTDAKGYFEIKNVNKGSYQLKITYVGFGSLVKNFTTPESGTVVDVGRLKLEPQATELAAITVKGERAPVVIRKDTIEFNAGSFKTKANANVEDLLKKLPGVEVDNDGAITAQGEQVQKVTVDGREFFGRDPKLATRNLPADAVDKVQIFDKKSEQATFTGIDDGQKEKTVNLELKEEKRNAAFGNMMAGAGTEDRFQAKASINRFQKGKQLSFLGMANNTNEQGFSINDYMNFSGSAQQMMGGGGTVRLQFNSDNQSGVPMNFGGRQSGIMTNYAGGVNFNQDFNKQKTQVSGSYFYSRLEENIERLTDRINYLPNGSYNFNQKSTQLGENDNHRLNFTVDHKIDSANSLRFNTTVSYTDSEQRLNSQSETMTMANALQNESERTTSTKADAVNLNSSLLYRHRFSKKGRTISANATFGYNLNDTEGNLESFNQFYGPDSEQDLLQTNLQNTNNLSYGTTVSFTEPLGKRKYLEMNYGFRANENDVKREVYDYTTGIPAYDVQLSNAYTSDYLYNRPGINFRMNREKFNVTLGGSYQMTSLRGDLIKSGTNIDRYFENFLPVVRFNYDFSTTKHFRLEYETSMQEPTIQQLQPVIDNSDPINIYSGNPDLKPAYAHTAVANFTTFDPAKFVNFFAFLTANYTTNAITNSQEVSPSLVRLTMPVNVKDNLLINGNLNFGFPLRELKSRFNLGTNLSHLRTINVLNLEENTIRTQNLGGTARYNFTYKEIFTLDLSANLRHQLSQYETDNQQPDQEYFNQTYSAETNITILKNYQFNANFDYLLYDSKTNSFSQSLPLLNIWLSRFLLKANAGEIRIGVSNVFDKSMSVTQNVTANYLEQQTINNLGRYYMVSFTYALNKQLNPLGGPRRGGGMRMMIRQD